MSQKIRNTKHSGITHLRPSGTDNQERQWKEEINILTLLAVRSASLQELFYGTRSAEIPASFSRSYFLRAVWNLKEARFIESQGSRWTITAQGSEYLRDCTMH